CRVDRRQTVRSIQVLPHPLTCTSNSPLPPGFPWQAFVDFQQKIQTQKEISPTDTCTPIKRRSLSSGICKYFIDANIGRNRPTRLTRIKNRQRYNDRSGPRGHFIDVDVCPSRQEHQLRRNGGHHIPSDSSEQGKIKPGKGICTFQSAERTDPL